MKQLSDFIYVNDNVLDADFCDHVIEKFESFGGGKPGRVFEGFDTSIKQSNDLYIDKDLLDEWGEVDKKFSESLSKEYVKYHEQNIKPLPTWDDSGTSIAYGNISDSGYQIQKTVPGGFYKWHNDFGNGICSTGDVKLNPRIITVIWYLNSVYRDGETEFFCGEKVKPRQGRICMFPCTWQYVHRGCQPKEQVKYIATTWIHPH